MSARRFLRRQLQRRQHGRGGFAAEALEDDLVDTLLRLEAALRDLAGGEGAPAGFDPGLFLAPGVPRVRPILVLLSARAAAAEGAGRRADDAEARAGAEHVAVAAELLHLAIDLHDAALGPRGGRRRRAARRLLGGAVGWLGGNHLTLRAIELSRSAPAPEIVGDLLDTLREITDGQALSQSLGPGRPGTSEECLAMADSRSGAVFSFACRAGARVVGADRTVVRQLGRYGRHAGIAWQLAEDLWAFGLDGDELGREVADRAAGGRTPLAVGFAAEQDPAIADAWRRLARSGDRALALHLARRVDEAGGLSQERQRLALETWTARKALRQLPPSRHREALDSFVAGMAG